MTSRPAQPGQRPPPQRALSGTGSLQRQAQHRSHLQNQLGGAAPGSSRSNAPDLSGSTSNPGNTGPSAKAGSGLRLDAIQEAKDNSDERNAQASPQAPVLGLPEPSWPRGKPRWMSDFQRGDPSCGSGATSGFASNATSPQQETQLAAVYMPMPLPSKPVRKRVSHDHKKSKDTAATVKKDNPPKPYTLKVPADAPHAPSDMRLDFFPWTGNHPEDKFSDSIIRSGYSDKSANETGSAKQGIYSALRNKNTLGTMGSLFAHILNERRKSGVVTAPPTFKPPPRVTLTDTKRETWVRDLANPSVSLRRLSRTIPHGIKNRVLLDQCALKDVPIERAVWLAKCVGANEIRASRRKGPGNLNVGGESKWIKDWTSCVAQFLENALSLGGDASRKEEGRSRIVYSLRLASHLYAEHLLDSAQYLDWVIESLEKSTPAKLALRLTIAEMGKDDLLMYRKTGRRYAAALCSHVHSIQTCPDKDIAQPILDKLTSTLDDMLLRRPESFISLSNFKDLRSALVSASSLLTDDVETALDLLEKRNNRLDQSSRDTHDTDDAKREVVRLLDTTYATPFTPELGKKCWHQMKQRAELAFMVFKWATSKHRPGHLKIFVSTRLLRIWSRHGVDVHEVAIDFLSLTSASTSICKPSLFHLYSELARSGHFSTTKYMQWLIARGGLRSESDIAVDGPCLTRLLVELPLCDLSDSAASLRGNLLHRAAFSMEDEVAKIDQVQSSVEACFPALYGNPTKLSDPEDVAELLRRLSGISRTMKAQLSRNLRSQVRICLTDTSPKVNGEDEAMGGEYSQPRLEEAEFIYARSILEHMGDIAILADVVKLVVKHDTSDPEVLAACANTVSLHRESFAAIGALKDLFDLILSRYRTLAVVQSPNATPLLNALYPLAVRVAEEPLQLQLRQDLLISKQRTVVDACSPVSDHAAEVLANTESDAFEELEKVLYSGSSMDGSTLTRLFDVLTAHIESYWERGTECLRKYSTLLGRLRSFDNKKFASLLSSWFDVVLERDTRPSLGLVFGSLIVAECVSFADALKGCSTFLREHEDGPAMRAVVLETLDLALGISDSYSPLPNKDSYSLAVKRSEAYSTCAVTVLEFTEYLVRAVHDEDITPVDDFAVLCEQELYIGFLQSLVVSSFDSVNAKLVAPLANMQEPQVANRLRMLFRSLLYLPLDGSSTEIGLADRVELILGAASDLTLPFCQLALRSVMPAGEESESANVLEEGEDDSGTNDPLQAIERAVDKALDSGNGTWTSIIPMLDSHIAQHLCKRFEGAYLDILSAAVAQTEPTDRHVALADKASFVMRATAYSMRNNRTPDAVMKLVERVGSALRSLQQGGDPKVFEVWLPSILAFIRHLTVTMSANKTAEEAKARLLTSIAAVHLVMQARNIGSETLREMVFDNMIALVDDLSDAARERVISVLSRPTPLADRINTPSVAQTSTPATTQPQITQKSFAPSEVGLTAAGDPALRYILSFGERDGKDEFVLVQKGKVTPYILRRWENLTDPTPVVGENDASLNLRLFEARRE